MVRYQHGTPGSHRYSMRLDVYNSGIDTDRANMMARFIDIWCQKNCIGSYFVEDSGSNIAISFNEARDVVLFKISEEYSYFDTLWKLDEDLLAVA
jgi:hypothetical protein